MRLYSPLLLLAVALPGAEGPIHDIPRLDGVVIDGDAKEWDGRGFRVDALTELPAALPQPADFDARLRLGWDAGGLLVLVQVRDDLALENPDQGTLWMHDSVELFLEPAGAPGYQPVIAPGMDLDYPELRMFVYDHRPVPMAVHVEVARRAVPGGYSLEARLPWPAPTPALGGEVAFQAFVNDADQGLIRFRAAWQVDGQASTQGRHRLRLAMTPSAPIDRSVSAGNWHFRRFEVAALAPSALAGAPVEVRDGTGVLATGTLALIGDRAGALLAIPLPATNAILTVVSGDQLLGRVAVAPVTKQAKRALGRMEFAFHPFVFASSTFPAGDFIDPERAEDLVGPYAITRAFYDAQGQRVTRAERPGRYGAVVDVRTTEGDLVTQRFCTLFRLPQAVEFGSYFNETRDEIRLLTYTPSWPAADIDLPAGLGIDPPVVSAQRAAVSDRLSRQLFQAFPYRQENAVLLAALQEHGKEPGPVHATASDRAWWWTLRNQIGLAAPITQVAERLPTGWSTGQRWPLIV